MIGRTVFVAALLCASASYACDARSTAADCAMEFEAQNNANRPDIDRHIANIYAEGRRRMEENDRQIQLDNLNKTIEMQTLFQR